MKHLNKLFAVALMFAGYSNTAGTRRLTISRQRLLVLTVDTKFLHQRSLNIKLLNISMYKITGTLFHLYLMLEFQACWKQFFLLDWFC
jgi:hypothetical protein